MKHDSHIKKNQTSFGDIAYETEYYYKQVSLQDVIL